MAVKIDSFQKGVNPITADNQPLQLLTLKRDKGEIVNKHTHPKKIRQTNSLQECLVVIKGKIKVDLYSFKGILFESIEVSKGEAFITLDGDHAVEFLEDSEVFEVKNGPH